MRTGALGGTSLASGTNALLSEERISRGSSAVAALARLFRGVSQYPGGSWTPRELFANGEQGAWYDPSDITTLFQDSDATVPVTDVGQPVGYVLDKSGLGNHLVQTTAARRPTWQRDDNGAYHLAFDGIDDCMVSVATVDFSAIDKLSVFVGLRKLSDAAFNVVLDLTSTPNTTNGAFAFGTSTSAGDASRRTYGVFYRRNELAGRSALIFAAPITNVVSAFIDAAQATTVTQMSLRVDGKVPTMGSDVPTASAGTFTNGSFFVGRRNQSTLPFAGRIYALIVRGAATNTSAITSAEAWVAAKTGVSLP